MSKLATYGEACNGVNDGGIFGDGEAERREEPLHSVSIGSPDLLAIDPAVLWIVPSDRFLLFGPVSCIFVSGSKAVVLEPMF